MIGSSKIKKQKYTVNGPCTVVTLEILIFLGFSYMPDVGDILYFVGCILAFPRKKFEIAAKIKYF